MPVRELIEDWSRRFSDDLISCLDGESLTIRTVVHMPVAHAVLICHGVWRSWMLPLLSKRARRGHAYKLGTPLFGDCVPEDLTAEDDEEPFAPSDFLEFADALRKCLSHVPLQHSELRNSVTHHLGNLQGMRDRMVLHQAAMTKRAFDMEHVIEAIVVSGFV